jgi:hypothetical protein
MGGEYSAPIARASDLARMFTVGSSSDVNCDGFAALS